MENTFVIYDESFQKQTEILEKELSIEKISYQAHENEKGFHDWLTREFNNNDIRKIIIPLSLQNNDTEGFLLGLHIRLNYELPIEKRTIPIIFLSNMSYENILTKCSFDEDNNPQNLLLTDGVSISSTDVEEIVEKLETTNALEIKDYPLFLKRLSINRKSITGGHDIANAWGCYKLAQVIENKDDIGKPFRIKDVILGNEFISKHLKQLYAKYLICKNNSYNNSIELQKNAIKCSGKRILLIDDKADEGWGELMQYIFKSAGNGFLYVNPSKYKNKNKDCFLNFDGFYEECKSYIGEYWDLVIIDLRLNPNSEDMVTNSISPTEFSGYKLIEDFLNNNGGYQIMVSTASNKIWNVNAALKIGAKGYYIKESPEFNYPISETKKQFENFKNVIEICFENAYLQNVYSSINAIKKTLPDNDFGASIGKQFELAFYLISKAETKEQYAFSYVSLYQIIEIITDYYITKEEIIQENDDDKKQYKWKLDNGDYVKEYKWDNSNKIYIVQSEELTEEKITLPQWEKMAGIVFQMWNCQDGNNLVRNLSYLIEKRNGFVHNDKSIIDKQDINGQYVNHDIYKKEGFQKLFYYIKMICSYIY